MMSVKIYAENHGKMNLSIYVLFGLKSRIKEDTVFVVKAKTHKLNGHLKQILSSFCNLTSAQNFFFFSATLSRMLYLIKNKDD